MHDQIEVRPARPEDLASVAALIVRSNGRAETQCLHSDEVAETAAVRLAKVAAAGEGRVVVAAREQSVVGAVAADVDEAAGRAWLWGPFAADGEPMNAVAPSLLARLEALLPGSVNRLDAFPNERNAAALDCFLVAGFTVRERHHIYVAERSGAPAAEGVVEADDTLATAAWALHDASFPEGYLSAADFVGTRDASRRLFVVPEGAGVAGYLYAERADEDGEGYIHYVAVAPEARGRGLGGRLVGAALHWLFEAERAPRVSLTVRGENAGARRLYERLGFARLATGVALRRDLSGT